VTEVEAAYIGAVLDTDGHVSWQTQKGKYRYPTIGVTNQNLEIISALLRTTRTGCVSFQQPGVRGSIWQWQKGGVGAVTILQEVEAFSTKAQKFLASNEFMSYTD
jgi:hypothetical protein